jgi:hypothetical protein
VDPRAEFAAVLRSLPAVAQVGEGDE